MDQEFSNNDALQKRIEAFTAATKNIDPSLHKPYVEAFLTSLDPTSCASLQEIDTQETLLFQLDKELKEAASEMRKKALPYLQKLVAPENALYKDLSEKAESLLQVDVPTLLANKLQPDAVSAFHTTLHQLLDNSLAEIIHLIDIAKVRNEKLKEVEFFQKDFLKLIEPLQQFKDLKGVEKELRDDLQPLVVAKQKLAKAHPETVSQLFDEYYAQEQMLLKNVQAVTQSIKEQCQTFERHLQEARQTIRRRLFEIFTAISPYRDLLPIFTELRLELNEKIEKLVDEFYTGKKTLKECAGAFQDMAYEHDVVILRNEITHRSSRLKDLRDEVYRLTKEVQHAKRLMELDSATQDIKIYRDCIQLIRALWALIGEIEDPFSAFFDASTKDEVNYVFRSFWMKVEELQPQVETLIAQAQEVMKPELVRRAFLQALDTVEEVEKATTGIRPMLVVQAEKEETEKAYTALEVHLSYVKPFSFYMSCKDLAERSQLLSQAKELEEKMEVLRIFAKAMQYMKTFEEERVDAILEAFERVYMLDEEDAFSKYYTQMQNIFSLVLEEVLLDIGFLDFTALMDVDPERLKKILRYAIGKAHKYEPILQGVCAELQSGSLLWQKTIENVAKKLSELSQKELFKEASLTELQEHLCLFCHQIFDIKLLLAAKKQNSVAIASAVTLQLHTLVEIVREWLETLRGKLRGAWGKPWIAECHAIRHTIERFQQHSNSFDELKPLIAKVFDLIYKIPEVRDVQARNEDPLQLKKMAAEFEETKSLLEMVRKKYPSQRPFVYLPGDIRFFTL